MNQTSTHPGKERRKPKITQRNYLLLSNLATLLRNNIKRFLSGKDLLILDCGCGDKPYFPFFENLSSLYVGIDLERGEYVDVVCDVEKIPFKEFSFDAVLCTQVLEHVISPLVLIDEIYKVLKDGGFLFLSTHGVWPVHEDPLDFWRWTDLGLKRMLSQFQMVKIFECGGNIACLFQILNLYVPEHGGKGRYIGPVISLFLNKIGESLDNRFKRKVSTKLIINYLAVARK